jgi:hypothetical protein
MRKSEEQVKTIYNNSIMSIIICNNSETMRA